MARKSVKSPSRPDTHIVLYCHEEQTYQIDPGKRKVYRRFVEIESSRAFQIFTSWRATQSLHL